MLGQTHSESRGRLLSTGINSSTDGFFNHDPKQPGCFQAVHRNTVKELLMLRRQERAQDVLSEPHCKSPKIFFDAFASDTSPRLPSPPPLFLVMPPNAVAQFPPAAGPQRSHVALQHVRRDAALQGQTAAALGVKMTLFEWQIQQEAQRLEGVAPEMITMQDEDGDTFLHIAVAQGKRALAFVLAAKMASSGSLDIKEHNGQTPLQLAIATNQHLIVQDLLAQGSQVNTRDSWGRSPLHVCAEKGYYLSLQSICRSLSGSGQRIDVEILNYDGLTPLHAAVLSHNAVVKEQGSLGNMCSYMARKLGQERQTHVQCIRTLLHMGASYGTKDLKSGRTCLHMAAEEANVELLKIFLEQPSSLTFVNMKTFSGNTALHVVSSLQNQRAQAEAARLLMRNGADPGARNLENELPSQLAPEGPVGDKVRQILKGKYAHA